MTPIEEYLKFRRIDEKAIEMLVTGNVFYSSPSNFNDPLDCAYSISNFPKEVFDDIANRFKHLSHDLRNEISKKQQLNYGIVSFSGYRSGLKHNPFLDPNLWGHYADNHKGICIGFSPVTKYHRLNLRENLGHQTIWNIGLETIHIEGKDYYRFPDGYEPNDLISASQHTLSSHLNEFSYKNDSDDDDIFSSNLLNQEKKLFIK